MANPFATDGLTARERVALVASLSDQATCSVLNDSGGCAAPPPWLRELFNDINDSEVPFDRVVQTSQHDVFVAFAASRRLPHVVSATRIIDSPEQLRQLHLISIAADDPDGTGEKLTLSITFPDDDATVFQDDTKPEEVQTRWIEYRCNELGAILTFDPEIEALMGWKPADLLGETMLNISHPEDAEESIDRWLTMLTTTQPVRGRVRRSTKFGDWKSFETTITNRLETDGYVLCQLLDITSEMKVFDELREQEELLRQLTDALPTGVVHFDRMGGLLFANDRLAEITGVLHGKLEDYLELFDPATQADIQAMAYTIYNDAIEVDMEAALFRSDGQVRHTRLAFRPLLVDHKGAGGLLICVDDMTESWTLRNELAKQANTDGLTGVANRSAAHDALMNAIGDRRSDGTGVVYFDLNGFKTANDTKGHAHGDEMLVMLADRLSAAARDSDTVGRLGGDEFVVIAPGASLNQVAALAKRLLDAANAPDEEFAINAACGFTFVAPTAGYAPPKFPLGSATETEAERAISEADVAMYVHKRNPGPWPVLFHPSFLAPELSDVREAS